MPFSTTEIAVNDRVYRPPARPIAVICIDGCADEYLSVSLARGRMPRLARLIADGAYRGMVRGALPSFTNVNNSSIATGVAPSVHGISGNFFLDPQSGEEMMMNSSTYLRSGTIFAAAARAGRKVAVVTAKEKLRGILSDGLFQDDAHGIAFSTEKARDARRETHGIDDVEKLVGKPTPDIYSAAASLYVLEAGVALVDAGRADFLYLSLTDFMQHKFAPDTPESLDFHEAIDRELGHLVDLGCEIGATADHGMNSKQLPDGSPNVIYLETILREEVDDAIRVILPITDPYVVHHGALGSFASVHLPDSDVSASVARRVLELDGITEVHDRDTAARKLELPHDRIGDIVALSGRDVVIGRTPDQHDLTAVARGLRSHGGRYEEMVPLVLSGPLTEDYARKAAADPRNFDVFDFTVNGIAR